MPHRPKIAIVILSFLLIGMMTGILQGKYHPEIQWREIAHAQFIVVFPQGYESTATYTLQLAEAMLPTLLDLCGTHIQIRGPIRILLSDSIDDSNGSATFVPYNHIEIFLYNPPPDSTLGSYQEWIQLALPHELTHILHFNAGSGFTYFWRHLLGSNPILYPSFYSPTWAMEGLAIYNESQLNRGGRLNTPDYALMLDLLAREHKIPHWADFWGAPDAWPGASSNYLYGASFIQFLAKKYGQEKLKEFLRLFTRYPIPLIFKKGVGPLPLTIQNRFHLIFGASIGTLWRQFTASRVPTNHNATGETESQVHLLTTSGHLKKYPIPVGTSQVVYIEENNQEYPGIYSLDTHTGHKQRLATQRGVNGCSYHPGEHTLYFSATDQVKPFYYYSDIYTLNLNTRQVHRLTSGKRLFYPIKLDATTIYCVKRINTQSFLCRLNPQTGQEDILSQGFDALAFPAISPDRQYIAMSLKQREENWRIGLFDLKGSWVDTLSDGTTKCYYPQWQNNQTLWFISEYQQSYRLSAFNLLTHSRIIYNDNRLPAIKYFSFMPATLPEPPQVIGSFFAANGFNLGTVAFTQLASETVPAITAIPAIPATRPPEPPAPPQTMGRNYRFLRELRPQAIGFTYRDAGLEYQPGILLEGADLVSRHAFSVEGFYGFHSRTANLRLNYTYNGLRPSLSLTYSDLSDSFQGVDHIDFMQNKKKLQLSGLYPLSLKNQRQTYLYADIHLETQTGKPKGMPRTYTQYLNGVKTGFFYNSAHTYYDAFSPSDGAMLSLSYGREFKCLGSDYDSHGAALEYKHYLSLLRPNVLAFRLALLHSWGQARRRVYMGGNDSMAGFQVVGNDLFTLMRAYPDGYFTGSGGWLANMEYRLAITRINKAFLIFSSLDRLYATLFVDTGNLWTNKMHVSPALSVGAELNLLTFVGDYEMTITAGLALGHEPDHADHTSTLYLRIGHTF